MSGVQRVAARSAEGVANAGSRARLRWELGQAAFPVAVAALNTLTIALCCIAVGTGYHLFVYGSIGLPGAFATTGLLVAFFDTLPFAFRGELGPERFIGTFRPRRRLLNWTWAFVAVGVVAFLTKSTATFSRGWLLLFYVVGGACVITLEIVLRRLVQRALSLGRVARRRVMLIGTPDEINRFDATYAGRYSTLEVACVAALPDTPDDAAAEVLARAVQSARSHNISDVVLLTDWSRTAFIDAAVASFSLLPVAIHLDADRIARRFTKLRIMPLGPFAALSLTKQPLTVLQMSVKRLFDIVVASAALIALSGLFAVVAALIKLDSPGPVFFRQRRLGYNQREFRIYKFRTMTAQDDGDHVRQATRDDARITWIGRYLRRYNIDELPQLINVLRGEMSIVGPRPHAIAHDKLFETRIEMYPRRLNVRPGITGWAQVQGLRGVTDTDDKMAARVAQDLYYIDNWSLGFDLYIMALTVLSPRAYRNAI